MRLRAQGYLATGQRWGALWPEVAASQEQACGATEVEASPFAGPEQDGRWGMCRHRGPAPHKSGGKLGPGRESAPGPGWDPLRLGPHAAGRLHGGPRASSRASTPGRQPRGPQPAPRGRPGPLAGGTARRPSPLRSRRAPSFPSPASRLPAGVPAFPAGDGRRRLEERAEPRPPRPRALGCSEPAGVEEPCSARARAGSGSHSRSRNLSQSPRRASPEPTSRRHSAAQEKWAGERAARCSPLRPAIECPTTHGSAGPSAWPGTSAVASLQEGIFPKRNRFIRSFVRSGSNAAEKQQTSVRALALFAPDPDVPSQRSEVPPAHGGLPSPAQVGLFLPRRETPNFLRNVQ
ncbi:translation initiation factor IF-2-like [Macaca thibetana thibetana]|uniref:translation initiation factor IF-2-like n=1 Tax=Macaca thibetana thibetana TaxID=257877 RepID=UPI0021BCF3D2|nr:translation initiation factor IF-2-like [Macaca thibetana thibetana]